MKGLPARIRGYSRFARAAFGRKHPVYAHFGITHRCNLTCRMCGIWRYGNAAEELSLDQVRLMAGVLSRLGVVQLSIGGGEPFQRGDLEDCVEACLDVGLELRLLTNGVGVSPSRLEHMVQLGVSNFSVSLDSLYPARFDHICERAGAWTEAVRSITVIADLLKGRRAMPVINCVVSQLNLEELQDIIHFARDLGFAVSFLPIELLADPRDAVGSWEARFVRFEPAMRLSTDSADASRIGERVDRAYNSIIRMKREGYPVLNSTAYLEASRNYLKSGLFPAEGCDAGRLYFSIAPNGQFTVCHRTEHQHRHILDPGFEEYFLSDAYESLRLDEVASCDGCMRACWIDTSAIFRTMRGLAETARLPFLERTSHPLTWEQARTWARYDLSSLTVDEPVVG